jgi:hypothetical protein
MGSRPLREALREIVEQEHRNISNMIEFLIQDHCRKSGVMIKKNQFLSSNQKGRGTKPST